MSKFKNYLITEQTNLLNDRLSPLINTMDSLKNDVAQLGNRQIIKSLTNIANEIRKILNDDWPNSTLPTLKFLQKIALFILKSIDEKSDDLKSVVDIVSQNFYSIADKSKIQLNNL